jgi:hypothetical protein
LAPLTKGLPSQVRRNEITSEPLKGMKNQSINKKREKEGK